MYMVRHLSILSTCIQKFNYECRSNTVVYNLWSGCLEIRNNTTPKFNTWTALCRPNVIDITYNDYPLHDEASGVDIPTWAYINVSKDSTFDLDAALHSEFLYLYLISKSILIIHVEARGWTTTQIILPITFGLLTLGALGALYFYHRRKVRKLERGDIPDNTWWLTFRCSRRLLGMRSGTQARQNSRYRRSWAIDDFETAKRRQSIDSEDGQHGYEWLTPAPPSPPPEHLTQKIQRYIRSSSNWWRNPFKEHPVQIRSLPPRQGFRVDDTDVSTNAATSRRPTLEPYDGLGNDTANQNISGWSAVNGEEIFDARDDGLDENSVLLISRAPGVDFTTTSPTTDTNVIPSPPPHPTGSPGGPPNQTSAHPNPLPSDSYPNYTMENVLRPARTDPVMLFPASVRAAGYMGIPTPYIDPRRASPNRMPLVLP